MESFQNTIRVFHESTLEAELSEPKRASNIATRVLRTPRWMISLALLSSVLVAAACDSGAMAPSLGGIPDVINWGDGFRVFTTRLYGHVSLADSTPVGPGFSVAATIYKTGCDGETVGGQAESSTTDAEGRYVIRTYVAEYELPPGSADRRILCTKVTAWVPRTGVPASIVIPDLVHHAGLQTDSVKVDLRLR